MTDDTGFFGHPRGLRTLFFTEMWERFSYYGMRALLILFMTSSIERGGLGFPVVKAAAIYGMYTAMVYLLCLPGGWVADRITGQRRAVLYGALLIIAGQFSLMAPGIGLFYLGLVLLTLGTGMLKPNVSTIVGQLYHSNDVRRDAGFSIFYMGINLGALLAPLACGWVGERISWRFGFGLAGFGMVIGLIQYTLDSGVLGDAGRYPANPLKRGRIWLPGAAAAALALIALAASRVTWTAERISNGLGTLLILVSAAIFAWLILGRGWTSVERKRSAAILVLFLASVVFYAAYEQAGSSFNLFAERSTDRHLFGYEFPASWFQFLPAAFVVLLAPVFAWLWIRLREREPSSPAKFAFGLLLVGLGVLLLVPAAIHSAGGVMVTPLWLSGAFLLSVFGELCLSPVALSAMTKLAPVRIGGMMMGVFFFSLGVGNYLAGRMASLYEQLPLPALFGVIGGFTIAAAMVLAFLVGPTVRLMSGVK